MDSIVDKDFINNYRFAQNLNCTSDELMPDYFWLNNTDWARERYQHDGSISIEEAYSLYGSGMFIRMTRSEANELTDNYIANHVVRLKIDLNRNCLCIKVDDEKDWLYSPALHENKDPFEILLYAFSNPNKRITREELFNEKGIDVKKKYLKSQVFSDNGAVKALSQTQLLDLEKKWLMVRKVAKLTTNELNKLKSVFKF